MAKCEDYPTCGHIDDLGCTYDMPYHLGQQAKREMQDHWFCAHNQMYCVAVTDDDDVYAMEYDLMQEKMEKR